MTRGGPQGSDIQQQFSMFKIPLIVLLEYIMISCNGRKRDKAHLAVKQMFYQVIQRRREAKEQEDDILQTLIDSTYK